MIPRFGIFWLILCAGIKISANVKSWYEQITDGLLVIILYQVNIFPELKTIFFIYIHFVVIFFILSYNFVFFNKHMES